MKVGGWAALFAAVAPLFGIAALFVGAESLDDPLASPQFITAEAARAIGLLIASIAFAAWLQELDRPFGLVATVAGVTGTGIALVSDASSLLGAQSSWFDLVVLIAANVAIALWLIFAGAAIGKAGGELGRVGWVGQLGGVGTLLATFGLVISGQVPIEGLDRTLIGYAGFLGLFGVIFLVRLWGFASLGRLPGAGLI
jgi:hypothetical protein